MVQNPKTIADMFILTDNDKNDDINPSATIIMPRNDSVKRTSS